jgi:hypothetical protein
MIYRSLSNLQQFVAHAVTTKGGEGRSDSNVT